MKAVIFDMDGLLFDTEASGRWAWEKALQNHGYLLTDAIYMQFVGRDMSHRERVLRACFGAHFPFESVKAQRISLGDQKEIEQGIALKPGAVQLLESLFGMDVPIGLATGTVRARALRRLESAGIRNYFHAVVGGDEVRNGKPAPDVFLEAGRRLGVCPQGCLVFEDSCAGIRAASDAGMRAVMVPDLEQPTPDIERLAYSVLASLEDAAGRLAELLALRALPP